MPIIAIAGGTSPTLGRALVQALQQTSNTPIVLSRQSPTAPKIAHNAPVRQVIYDNHTSLVEALRGVQTVLCVIKTSTKETADTQIALIHASKAAGVKRFAPSEFGLGPLSDSRLQNAALRAEVWAECERSGLEVTRFCCGVFMNFLGIGVDFAGNHARELSALGGLKESPMIWDLARGEAEEPVNDDGRSPSITMTDVWDVGKFVAAACDLPLGRWEAFMGMVGETIEISEVTKMIGRASGRDLRVTKVRRSELEQRQRRDDADDHRDEIVTKMVVQFEMLEIEDARGTGVVNPILNKMFPDIKPKSVEQYLKDCWGR